MSPRIKTRCQDQLGPIRTTARQRPHSAATLASEKPCSLIPLSTLHTETKTAPKAKYRCKRRVQKEARMGNVKLISTINMIDTIMTPTTQPHGTNGKRASTDITTRIREGRATRRKISTSKTRLSFTTPQEPGRIYIRGVAQTKKLLSNRERNKANFPNVNIPNILNLMGLRRPRAIRALKPTSRPKGRMKS